MGEGELDGGGLAAIVLAIVAWMTFAAAFFLAEDPFLFLLIALGAGIGALVLGLRARRAESAAAAAGATAAGAAFLYGLTLVAVLTAMVYATGFLLFLILLVFLGVMATPNASSSGGCGSGGGSGGPPDNDGCCEDCCDCGCDSACDCGCGGCDCGGCGGCGCIAYGLVAVPVASRPARSWRRVLHRGLAHHPRTPAYDQDVYRIGDARWCVGCFTTYPALILASALLILAPPAWTAALAIGLPLASMQALSSAGLAKRRWMKAIVKASLGVGLAFLVVGIHQAPWIAAVKVASYLAVLALAWGSTLPRRRRMRLEDPKRDP